MWNAGTTALSSFTSKEEGTTKSKEFSAGAAGGVEIPGIIDVDIQVGYTGSEEWQNSETVENSITFAIDNAMDGAVVTCTPVDVYSYEVFIPKEFREAGKEAYDTSYTNVVVPCHTQTRVMDVARYNSLVDSFNAGVEDYR